MNCVRTIPHLRSLYDRYQKDGLVVVGIHSPEFDFEKNHDNVKAAVTRLHVDYPVALDDDMAIWNEFSNNVLAGRLRRRPSRTPARHDDR